MFKLNRIFIGAMAAAVIGTVGATLLQLHPLIVLVGGLVPLIYYFLRLMVLSKSGISQTAVDSIYYFGFIVTIASLAASVLSVAFFGIDRDINLLIAQFGVGLLATGLALVFRMILLAKLESLNQKDLSETIDDYVRRIDHVVTRVEASAASFDGLSNSLIERTKQISETTQAEFQAAMRLSAESFQQEMLRIVSSFSEQTSVSIKKATTTSEDFFSLVQNISLSGHVQDISSQVGAISAGLKQFSEETASYTRTTLAEIHKMTKASSAAALEDFSQALQATVTRTAEGLSAALRELGQLNFVAESQAVKAELQGLTRNLNAYAKKLATTESKVENVAENVAVQVGQALQNSMAQHSAELAASIGNSVRANVDTLRAQLGDQMQSEFPAFLERLSAGIADAMQSLKREVQSIQQGLAQSNLGPVTEKIQGLFSNLSKEAEALSDAMQMLGTSLSDKTNVQIEQSVQDAMVRVSSVWSQHIDQFGAAMEQQLRKLTQSITAVENAVDLTSVQADFNDLSNGIQSALQGMDAMKAALEKITSEAMRGTDSLEGVSMAARGASETLSRVQQEISHPITIPAS